MAGSSISRISGPPTGAGDGFRTAEGSFDESIRGRERPSSSSKDKEKGNVVISVRVRPEKDPKDEAGTLGEWMVDGRKSLISFKGKEGGEYIYGMPISSHSLPFPRPRG